MTPTPYPPNLPHPATSNFCLFPQIKKGFEEICFADVKEVKQKTAEALKGIKINKFKNCFEQWKKCLNRCIVSSGEYFEGDKFKRENKYIIFYK